MLHTLSDIDSFVARQSRQRRSAKPTPTLKPPIACAAIVSANITKTAPFEYICFPFTSSKYP